MSWFVKLRKEKTRRREKQARLPKKPRFEPKSKIIAGKHKPVFKKATEI